MFFLVMVIRTMNKLNLSINRSRLAQKSQLSLHLQDFTLTQDWKSYEHMENLKKEFT